ncbi:MAG: extracellular solute-binding protein [Lachnospiraceae bacterium]|nr:extracellular solute-binding protein [Lachnospiraceae bacterium]
MNKKKLLSASLVGVMGMMALTGCGDKDDSGSGNGGGAAVDITADATKGQVRFLNFKPEIADAWQTVIDDFTAETGIEVTLKTAASGTYEQTLKADIAKKDAPTLFTINGPIGYASWKKYCADLSGTDLYSWLSDKGMAISEGSGVYGIPYVVEGYGIIYNNAIMDKYFASANKTTSYTSMDEVNNFEALKAVTEDMQALKDELGIEGVFASTSFSAGEDWRWQTHLANLPIHYELKEKGVLDLETIDFSYAENYKNILDLYINNSVTEKSMLATKKVDDSMAEFALGKCAMVQNGNWGWGQISGVDGNVVNADDVKFLPIYTGVEGEESQGICVGTENFWAVNTNASAEDQAATVKFMEWLFNSEKGKNHCTNTLGFIAPFNTFSDSETPTDPLAKEVIRWMNSGVSAVTWDFTIFPSQTFKDNLGADLLSYCSGNMDWDTVVSNTKDSWATEKAAIAE